MNKSEVEEKIYELAAKFFAGATVLWSEQINTKPPLPYVTLKCSGLDRTSFPVVDGEGRRAYQASITLEVNLFTKGKQITGGEGVTGNYANTAEEDLIGFADFVESEAATDWMSGDGIGISLMPPVRDLTELQNDSRYRYRAMAEFSVSFVLSAGGPFGIGGTSAPNHSGGGTKEMEEAEMPTIETVEIEEEE